MRRADDFNLCPADICRVPEAAAPSGDLGAVSVQATPGLQVARYDPPPQVARRRCWAPGSGNGSNPGTAETLATKLDVALTS